MRVSVALEICRGVAEVRIEKLQQAAGEAGEGRDGGSQRAGRARQRRGTTGCLSGCYGDRTPAVSSRHT